jgi:hypothetical protein
MKLARAAALLILLAVPVSSALAGSCGQPQQYYNWPRVRQQNAMQQLRGIQQERRLCSSLKSSGRVALPPACR